MGALRARTTTTGSFPTRQTGAGAGVDRSQPRVADRKLWMSLDFTSSKACSCLRARSIELLVT